MISRETATHVSAVVLSILLVGAVELAGILPDTETALMAMLFLFYGIVLGGAHFYLALQGHDGMIPVMARWRYVAVLVILFVTSGAVFLAGDRMVAGVELSTIALGVAVLVLLGYLYTEAKAGYRQTKTGG